MHSYCNTCIYYFISFFSLLLSVSLVALTLTSLSLPSIIRERHTMHQQRTPHQQISSIIKQNKKLVLHRICLVAEKNTKKTRKKINKHGENQQIFGYRLSFLLFLLFSTTFSPTKQEIKKINNKKGLKDLDLQC